jgi:hypothetical protein
MPDWDLFADAIINVIEGKASECDFVEILGLYDIPPVEW